METIVSSFRQTSQEIWSAVSDEVGALNSREGFFMAIPLEVEHQGWRLLFATVEECDDCSKQLYTRVSASVKLNNREGFHVVRKTIFPDAKIDQSMLEAETGHDFFDQVFILRESTPGRLKQLLEIQRVRNLLEQLQAVELILRHSGDGDGECDGTLMLCVPGRIRQLDVLKKWFDLFSEALDHLCEDGVVRVDAHHEAAG